MTTITALPTPPSRDDPANFASRADDFLGALPTFVTQTNTVAGEVNTNASNAQTYANNASSSASTATTKANEALASANAAASSAATALNAPGTSATSTTSLTIGTGSKSLTIQAGKSIAVGASVIIAYTTTPTDRMSGTVTSYDSGSGALVVTVDATSGSGTYAAWTVSLGAVTAVVDQARTWTTQQTFKELKDTVHTISDGAAFEIDPANGSIQVVTLGASRTPAATNFEAGQCVLLGIDDGTAYSITWTTVNPTWVSAAGSATAPTLATTGFTWILLWKTSAGLFATLVGKP